MIKNQFHLKVQKVRTNNGGEFLSYYLTKFLSNEGIFHHKPVPILSAKWSCRKKTQTSLGSNKSFDISGSFIKNIMGRLYINSYIFDQQNAYSSS